MTIFVQRRSDDYSAHLSSDPRIWGRGKTIDDAIGDLVRSHHISLGIKVQIKKKR